MGRKMVMDPAGAVEALKVLRPKMVVPIHWGTFSSVPLLFSMKGTPGEFGELAEKEGSRSGVRILKEGASLEI